MKLKDITNFGKGIFKQGLEILKSRSASSPIITTEHPEKESLDKELELTPEQESLVRKFEIPNADNPVESARQQSMLDSQGIANKANYHGQGRFQGFNSNTKQRNFENHQQN